MKSNNPFKYTLDNKRYHTYNYAMRHKYKKKVAKISVDAGFTCPNRDGRTGVGGCIFCSSLGSGDMIDQAKDIQTQIEDSFAINAKKWPDHASILYFQSYSNTDAPLDYLKQLYDTFFIDDRFVGIDIATRSDCLDQEKVDYFAQMANQKDLFIEIGLQSIHFETARWMNRGHSLDSVREAVAMLKKAHIPICLHIINGFPNETSEMMIETARFCAELEVEMLKIHMLHVVDNSLLGLQYQKKPFPLLSKEEYLEIVIKQLEVLPPEMIIARVTGDGLDEHLLAPTWTQKKTQVTNDLDKLMNAWQTYQGKYYNKKDAT